MNQQEILKGRVATGVALLDKAEPGWRERIDLSILDLADPQCCILGQLFDGYEKGRLALAERYDLIPWTIQDSYGFDVPDELYEATGRFDEDGAYSELTRLWLEELQNG